MYLRTCSSSLLWGFLRSYSLAVLCSPVPFFTSTNQKLEFTDYQSDMHRLRTRSYLYRSVPITSGNDSGLRLHDWLCLQ
jgi:hypothetical protein